MYIHSTNLYIHSKTMYNHSKNLYIHSILYNDSSYKRGSLACELILCL